MGRKIPVKPSQSTYEQFLEMSNWLMQDMDRIPKSESQMLQQASQSAVRTSIFSLWALGKLFKLVFKTFKGVIRMVFGRGKKESINPAFMSPTAAQQLAAMNALLMQQQGMQLQGFAYPQPVQPVVQPMVQPMVQPVVQPVVQPAQRVAAPLPATGQSSVLEQLMLADMSLAEHLKSLDARLMSLEAVSETLETNQNELFNRLNMLQGVKPSGGKVTKFQK